VRHTGKAQTDPSAATGSRSQWSRSALHALLSGFLPQMILASLVTGGLIRVGAGLLGEAATVQDDTGLSCVAFQVGSPRAADTRINLVNDGPTPIVVRLDSVDHDGLDARPIGYIPSLDAGASSSFVFRTPALGVAVKLVSPGRNLRASVEIRHDDGEPGEIRKAIPCRA
jgi:hypothetical protein